jgi:5-methylcytosine-specific restriction endonuclease McrA
LQNRGKNHSHFIENLDRQYSLEFSKELKEQIRHRDNHECRLCHTKEEDYYRKLDIHHIDYNKQNCKKENLISLCNKCNIKVNYNREYWKSFFKELIGE